MKIFVGENAMSNSTRTSLLSQLRNSETEEAWAEFSDLYGSIIENWLRRQSVLPQDIEDLKQDVMVAVCSEIKNFEHNGRVGAFRAWLRRITVNRMYRLWEKRKKQADGQGSTKISVIADQLADSKARLSIEFDRQHDACLIEHLLGKLEHQFGATTLQAFRRLVLLEHSSRDVANDLGMSIGAVRVAQHRVLRSLRQLGQGILDYP
jgi:RNA polymerase sigma-70 factor (ECF subfamily)